MNAMTGAPSFSTRYDPTTIGLHWLVAVAVILQWTGGQTIDWFPKGPLKIDARSVHIALGASLAGLLLLRLYWRAVRGRRLPPAQTGPLGLLAVGTHGALILNLLVLVGLGLLLAGLRGDSLFNLVKLPALGDLSPKARHLLTDRITDLHGLAANLILALAGFHAAAALVHHLFWKDGVLRRML
jgi:cytochrome b561